MITVAIRALTGLVLALVLLTGCSGGESDARSGNDGPGPASASSPTPADGAVGSEDCALGRERLSFVVRDWGRVFGSIGRGDHHVFTRAFVEELEEVRRAGRDCNGSADLERFVSAARRIDERSRRA